MMKSEALVKKSNISSLIRKYKWAKWINHHPYILTLIDLVDKLKLQKREELNFQELYDLAALINSFKDYDKLEDTDASNLLKALRLQFGELTLNLVNLLSNDGLLDQDIFNSIYKIIKSYYGSFFNEAIIGLKKSGLLNLTNLNQILKNDKYAEVISVHIVILKKANLLSQENFDMLCQSLEYSEILTNCLDLLKNQLNQEKLLTLYKKLEYLEIIQPPLKLLSDSDTLTDEFFDLACKSPESSGELLDILKELNEHNSLNHENLKDIIGNSTSLFCAYDLARGFVKLSEAKLSHYWRYLYYNINAPRRAEYIKKLHSVNLLTSENLELLKQTILAIDESVANSFIILHQHSVDLTLKDKIKFCENNYNKFSISLLLNLKKWSCLEPKDVSIICYYGDEFLEKIFNSLKQASLLITENKEAFYDFLVKHKKHLIPLSFTLENLNEVGLLNQQNFNILLENPGAVWHLNGRIYRYAKQAKNLLSENLHFVCTLIELFESSDNHLISNATDQLPDLQNANILTDEIKNILVQNIPHTAIIGSGFLTLKKADILTSENIIILTKCPQYADKLARSLVILHESNILTDDTRKIIYSNFEYSKNVAVILSLLHQAKILNEKNIKLLTHSNQFTSKLVSIFKLLAKNGLLSQANFDAVYGNVAHHIKLRDGILSLIQAKSLTQENFSLLLKYAEFASLISNAIVSLIECDFYTDENRLLICTYPRYAEELAKSLLVLRETNLYNDANIKKLCAILCDRLGNSLIELYDNDLFSEENFHYFCQQSNIPDLVNDWIFLGDKNILTDENKETLAICSAQGSVGHLLYILHKSDLLTFSNRKKICENAQYAWQIYMALGLLEYFKLLTQENFDTLCANASFVLEFNKGLGYGEYDEINKWCNQFDQNLFDVFSCKMEHSESIAMCVRYLSANHKLSSDIKKLLQILVGNIDTLTLEKWLQELSVFGILTRIDFGLFCNHYAYAEKLFLAFKTLGYSVSDYEKDLYVCPQYADKLAIGFREIIGINKYKEILFDYAPFSDQLGKGLKNLYSSAMLTSEYKKILCQNAQYASDLSNAFIKMQKTSLLTTENKIALCMYAHYAQYINDTLYTLVNLELLNQQNFNIIMQICQNAADATHLSFELEAFIRRCTAPGKPFNPAQSTHTESVHKTVAISAMKLLKRYADLKLDKCIAELVIWSDKFNTSDSIQNAAKKSVIRLVESTYIEPQSNISMPCAMALVWVGIHDAKVLQTTEEAALEIFIKHLYEIQREYNLDKNGLDNHSKDDIFACAGGSFNKIIATLSGGLHPDVEIRYVTLKTATAKLAQVVKFCLIEHIKKTSEINFNQAKTDLASLKQNFSNKDVIPEDLWQAVSSEVSKLMKDEFAEDFQQAQLDVLIANGSYVNLDKETLENLDKLFVASTVTSLFFSTPPGKEEVNDNDSESHLSCGH